MGDPQDPICVTGASSFVGAQVVADLLADGRVVRGTVRDPEDRDRYGFLMELPGAGDRLTLHRGELLEESSFSEAMKGCRYCVHTASPYFLHASDPKKELVDPAEKGTENVLRAARTAGVERIVVTSSGAAITDEPENDRVLTERDWNEKSTLKRNPYHLSKVQAERAAWRFHDPAGGFSVVVINPFLVLGPSLTPKLNTSNALLADLLRGEYPVLMAMAWTVVDVRDVSEVHIRALGNTKASGRFICAGHTVTMEELVQLLREEGYDGRYRLPRFDLDNPVGNRIVYLLSFLRPRGVGGYLRTHLGRVPRVDNSKSQEVLGVSYRPLRETLGDALADLERWGHLPRPADT